MIVKYKNIIWLHIIKSIKEYFYIYYQSIKQTVLLFLGDWRRVETLDDDDLTTTGVFVGYLPFAL